MMTLFTSNEMQMEQLRSLYYTLDKESQSKSASSNKSDSSIHDEKIDNPMKEENFG